MAQHPAQIDYARRLKTLSKRELFEQMRATAEALHVSSRPSSPDLLWQSIVLEDEIIDRFPEKGLAVFHQWALQHH